MNVMLQDIQDLIQVAGDVVVAKKGRTVQAETLGDCAPTLLLVGEQDGSVSFADGFSGNVNYPAVTLLLNEMIQRLGQDTQCQFETKTDGGPQLAIAIRLATNGGYRVLGCLFPPHALPANATPAELHQRVTGAFAFSTLLFKERLNHVELRGEHLAAEHEMLAMSQAEAVSCHVEEREKRLREKEEHALKEQFFRAAEEANRAKSEFLANMSHEIRTPMTAILGFADMLVNRLSDREDLEAAHTIQRNGQHLLAIINDILDLSKIEAGKLNTEKVKCPVVEIVSDVDTLMRLSAEKKGLSFQVVYSGPVPERIETDPVRLRQILLNLVGNAVKFTERGEVCVTVHLADDSGGPQYLEFAVRDTGIGMTEQQIEQIFDPFTQANSSTTREFGGSGLGLAICERLAGMLGGEIRVRSTPGKGSVFTVTVATGNLDGVPLIAPADGVPETTATDVPAIRPATLHGRILLVEDGLDNQRLISLVLEKAGGTVQLAANGREALETVFPNDAIEGQMEPFDVILMDIQMPEMDGHEATRKLRQRGYGGPIIALSAHAYENEIRGILEAGCNEYLAKPIDREELIRVVQQSMR